METERGIGKQEGRKEGSVMRALSSCGPGGLVPTFSHDIVKHVCTTFEPPPMQVMNDELLPVYSGKSDDPRIGTNHPIFIFSYSWVINITR